VLNNPADVLSVVLRGTLGRSGRKRARRATKFLTGHGGFLSASTMIAASGVAWGIYDTQYKLETNRFINPGEDWTPELPKPVPTKPASAQI